MRFSWARLASLLIAAILMFAALPSRVEAQQTVIVATVNTDVLNMRTQANNRSEVVVVLKRGDQVKITGRNAEANWLYGTAPTGAAGWVVVTYLVFPATPDRKTLPVVNIVAPSAGGGTEGTPVAGKTATAAAPAVVSGSIGRGFELGGQVSGLGGPTVAAMRRAGMSWVKRQAFAGDGGAFGMIGEAKANGFKILLSVIGDKNSVTNDGYQDSYAGFVAQLAAAGANAIEIWNEQNLDREWPQGQINPALYVKLLAKAYNAIKKANPGTIVITGALAPTGAEGAFGLGRVWNDDRYSAGMAAAGAASYADCIGLHYNEGIVGPTQNSGDPRGFYPTRYFDTMLNRGLASFRGKQACFTELGYLTPEGYAGLPGGFAWAANVTVSQQAQWLAQAAVRASQSGRVRLMIIFNVDFTYYGEDPQGGYAIIRPGGGCPACETLASIRR